MADRSPRVPRVMMCVAAVAVMALLSFNCYPRNLKRVAGLEGVTPDDISHIQISMAVYEEPLGGGVVPRAEPIASNEIVTDRAFFEDVLDLLDSHTLRRRPFSGGVDYRRADLTRPKFTLLSVSLDNHKTLFISISNDPRFVSIWSSESDHTRYRLYGEGVDTIRLHESVLRLNPATRD